MKLHYNIRVRGRVQKVGFRFHTQLEATRNQLCGFVRNEPDGGVYIEAEGEEADLENFLRWCRKGPALAVIEQVEIRKSELEGFDSFIIRH